MNVGLHHHGDDPGAAGYTLEELFVLSRSSFLQQRVIAMQTLSRIIAQVKILLIDTESKQFINNHKTITKYYK